MRSKSDRMVDGGEGPSTLGGNDNRIVDELCICGRLKSKHDDRKCKEFQWVSFKLDDGTFWPDPAPIRPKE